MADPLSVVGGVVGILSLAIEVTQTLYNYYTSLKGQSKEITSILGSLRTLHKTLECLCHDLKHSKFPTGDLDLVNNISDIVQRCEGYIEELKQEATKFENITEKVHEKIPLKSLKAAFQITSRRLRARGRQLAYPIQENTLKDLRTHINHLNTELCFAINLLQSRGLYRIEEKQSSQISSDKSLQIRDWLKAPDAPIDFHSAKSKRHVGTGLWFIKGPSFTAWLGQPGSFLLLSGFAGCGKTVLCSAAIEEVLSRQKSNSRIGVAYFYFTFSDESKQRASQMLRALVLQLSVQLGGAPPALEQLYRDYSNDSNHTPPDQAVLACLQKLVQEFCDVYIILDALDECPRGKSQRAVCQAINDIRGWSEPRLHLLVTSRDEVDICKGVKSTPEETIFMRNDGINKDIASWVSQRLCESPEFRQWETHSHKIKQALIEKADGM
jgi:hypothetical protein